MAKDFKTYFDNTITGGVVCSAAALTLDKNKHIIICAPNIDMLKEVWPLLCDGAKLEVKKCPVVLYKYEESPAIKEPVKPERKPKTNSRLGTKCMWYYHHNIDTCRMDYEHLATTVDVELIGEAKTGTLTECRILLREKGWSRSDIQEVTIDTMEPIPF